MIPALPSSPQHRQWPPNLEFHFTPTYSSWLNQVESWFSKLQREVLDRGIFTSVANLRRKIMRYVRLYEKTAKPFRWKYADIRHRIPLCKRFSADSPLVSCPGHNVMSTNPSDNHGTETGGAANHG